MFILIRGGNKKFGSRKILVSFHGSCSLIFLADFKVTGVLILSQICLKVSQRKTIHSPYVSQSLKFTIRHPSDYYVTLSYTLNWEPVVLVLNISTL